MRQLRAAPSAPGPLILALCGLAILLCASCQYMNLTPARPDQGARKSAAEALPLGSWKSDRLNCAAGRCERWYEIRVEERGTLKVDLYAPYGSDLPDCEMELSRPDGEKLPARTGRVRTQRRLRYASEPAVYYLRVSARGPNRGRFDYDVHAQISGEAADADEAAPAVPRAQPAPQPPRPRQTPAPRPDIPMVEPPPEAGTAGETPGAPELPELAEPEGPVEPPPAEEEPPAAPPQHFVRAEVLDVEESGGEATAVMIEAGEPEGLKVGMRGELVDRGVVIGEIEVTHVYESGSRARIVGGLSAPVSFDTVSRIPVPPDGN